MKKARSKALKQLAEILPKAYIERQHTETGKLYKIYELKDKGFNIQNLPELTEENKDKIFSIKYDSMEVLNHHKRLKKVWKSEGTEGVQKYLLWLKDHNERWAQKHKDLDVEQLDDNLFKISLVKVGEFWNSLIVFLASFFAAFMKKK